MRLHDRYYLREITGPFLISLGAFLMMMSLALIHNIMDESPGHSPAIRPLALFLLYKVPGLARFTLPVALLVGSSLAISRLVHDSEIIPIRIAGLPLWRLQIPVVVLGLVFSGAAWVVAEYVTPYTEHRAGPLERKMLFEGEVSGLQPDTLFRNGNRIYYFHFSDNMEPTHTVLRGIVIYQLGAPEPGDTPIKPTNPDAVTVFWTADTAIVEGQVWNLTGVIEHDLGSEGETLNAFPTGRMRIDLHRNIQYFLTHREAPEELTAAQINTRIQAYEHLALPRSTIAPLEYEYAARHAFPFACLIVALVGAPLTLRFGRGGSLVGVLAAFGVIFLYDDVMVIAQKLCVNSAMSPTLAAWLPNIIFGVVGIWLLSMEV